MLQAGLETALPFARDELLTCQLLRGVDAVPYAAKPCRWRTWGEGSATQAVLAQDRSSFVIIWVFFLFYSNSKGVLLIFNPSTTKHLRIPSFAGRTD